jgi:hypothetical protein
MTSIQEWILQELMTFLPTLRNREPMIFHNYYFLWIYLWPTTTSSTRWSANDLMVLFIGFALFMDFYGKKIIMVSYCMTFYWTLLWGKLLMDGLWMAKPFMDGFMAI